MESKIEEYTTRYRFWNTQRINQLGYSINLFTTLGLTAIGYLISHKTNFLILKDLNECKVFTQYLTITLLFFSICFGITAIVSRLYDFKLTTNINLTRKRCSNKKINLKNRLIKDNINLSIILDIISGKDFTIKETEIISESKDLITKFNKNRKICFYLGRITWNAHMIQLLLLIASSICYIISSIFLN